MVHILKFPNSPIATALAIAIIILFLFTAPDSAQSLNSSIPLFRRCWTFDTQELEAVNGASDNKTNTYHVLLGGKVISLNFTNGDMNWESILGGKISSTPIIEKNNIVVASTFNDITLVRSLSRNSGVTEWQTKLDLSNHVYLQKTDKFLLVINKNGNIFALDFENGKLLWNKNINTDLSTDPLLFENQIIIGIKDKQILILSIEDGSYLLKKNVKAVPTIISKINKNILFWGDYSGNAYLLDLSTHKNIWKFRSGAEITEIEVTKDGLLLASADNFIYKVLLSNGKLIWKKRFDGRPTFSSYSSNENIIVFTPSIELLNILDVEQGKVINQLIVDEGNYIINKPLKVEDSIIISTVNGLISYSNSINSCLNIK